MIIRLRYFKIALLIIMIALVWLRCTSVYADDPCSNYFKDLLPVISAKPKPYMSFTPSQSNSVKDLFTDHLNQSFEVLRVLPDSHTRFGRFVRNMNQKGTTVFFDERLNGSVAGYSLFHGNFASGLNGPVIGLNPNHFSTPLLQQTLMHEGFHNLGVRLRKEERNFLYNSTLTARDGARLIEGMPYLNFVSSEEVHTFLKNFIHDSLKAHHRETLQEIEKQLKFLPNSLSREKKLEQVKLLFDSVIDSQSFEHMGLQSFFMTQQHHSLMKDLENKILKGSVSYQAADDGALKVITDRFEFVSNNLKFKENDVDVSDLLNEVTSLAANEEKIIQQMEPIHLLIRTAGTRGHFTAAEYMKLKDEMAKLAKLVKIGVKP